MGGGDLRVGIVGAGFIGVVHARSARLAGAHVAGVSASTPQRAAEAAAAMGAERAFDSAEELAVADGIDVVHICAPNHLHAPLAEAALAAGKHVVCEKPLALDAASAARLVDAAAAAPGQLAAVPFVYRFYPTIREARERVRSGETGAIHLLHGAYLQDWLLRPQDDNWRVDPVLGGASRAFADIGSHWCDLAQFVSGHRIARVSARMATVVGERNRSESRRAFAAGNGGGDLRPVDTEDLVVLQLETDEGALGSAVISQIAAGHKNALRLELDGAREALAFDQEDPERLWCGRREATTIVQRDPEHLSAPAARLTTLPPGHPEGYADCFDKFVADAYDAIRGDAEPDGLPTFADGLRAAAITDAVLVSAREERWVDVPAPASVDVGS